MALHLIKGRRTEGSDVESRPGYGVRAQGHCQDPTVLSAKPLLLSRGYPTVIMCTVTRPAVVRLLSEVHVPGTVQTDSYARGLRRRPQKVGSSWTFVEVAVF